jgi:hypothetical protein
VAKAKGLEDELKTKNMYTSQEGSGSGSVGLPAL